MVAAELADFGTCAPDWPLMAQWDKELAEGRMPDELRIPQSLKRS